MPPASFVGASVGACSDPNLEATFVLPSTTKGGDTILAFVAVPTVPNDGPDLDELDPPWTLEATFATADGIVWVMRREAEADELGNIAIPFPDGFPDSGLAILEVWRNLDTGAALVDSDSAAVAADTDFPSPSINLTAYSDLYVGITFVADDEVVVTEPAGTTLRETATGDGMTLALFDVLEEDVVATGIKTATTPLAQTGIAAAIALTANPLVGFGKSFTMDPVGALGLPAKGI